MALFEEQITDTLETGAPSIKYEGDEGPQDPRQEQMLAQLKEEYMQYVFEQKEIGEPIMSFEEWYRMVYEASKMGVQAPQEEMMSEEMMMREPAAYGGIMDTESGRRMYGFGSIFKKITKPFKKIAKGAKKVLKSPLGKAAALYFAPALIPGGASTMGGVLKNMAPKLSSDWLMKKATHEGGKKGILSAAKKFLTGNKGIAAAGIGALSALPLLGIGTQKQQQVVPDMGKLGSFDFDYDQMIRDVKGAKTTEDFADINTKYGTDLVEDETVYAADGGSIVEKIKEGIIEGGRRATGIPGMDEAIWIEKIKDFIRKKRGEGRPDPREEITQEEIIEQLRPRDRMRPLPRRPMPDMPRRGYALGTKADFAIEDVMTGGMEDEIGGITGIMRQADLQRKGNVGQFYAAQGGRIGYADGGDGGSFDSNKYYEDEYNKYIKDIELGLNEFADKPMSFSSFVKMLREDRAQGGRIGAQEGGIMDLGGMEKDYRNTGGFVELGAEEKADDVPARLSKNEFVMTADAVRGAGDGDIDKGASIMENMMKELEGKGKRFAGGGARGWKAQMLAEDWAWDRYGKEFYDLTHELQMKLYGEALDFIDGEGFTQKQGAEDMFEVSERLSEVV